jgi:enamine deaminase RidA (YjgF/YER057c/UK114 family)
LEVSTKYQKFPPRENPASTSVPSEVSREQPKVADGASELLQDVFGKSKNPSRLVYGMASLPFGTPVELELILEVF